MKNVHLFWYLYRGLGGHLQRLQLQVSRGRRAPLPPVGLLHFMHRQTGLSIHVTWEDLVQLFSLHTNSASTILNVWYTPQYKPQKMYLVIKTAIIAFLKDAFLFLHWELTFVPQYGLLPRDSKIIRSVKWLPASLTTRFYSETILPSPVPSISAAETQKREFYA